MKIFLCQWTTSLYDLVTKFTNVPPSTSPQVKSGSTELGSCCPLSAVASLGGDWPSSPSGLPAMQSACITGGCALTCTSSIGWSVEHDAGVELRLAAAVIVGAPAFAGGGQLLAIRVAG